jgi:hypothetical protein
MAKNLQTKDLAQGGTAKLLQEPHLRVNLSRQRTYGKKCLDKGVMSKPIGIHELR